MNFYLDFLMFRGLKISYSISSNPAGQIIILKSILGPYLKDFIEIRGGGILFVAEISILYTN